jgi:2-polyprenyl-6-methoxyphenol hydroxylase-like FAD-dependent oxidoreductase
LIGADGIHSAVRRHFYPGEAAVFDGYLHYRGSSKRSVFDRTPMWSSATAPIAPSSIPSRAAAER